jgi:oligoribonuclease
LKAKTKQPVYVWFDTEYSSLDLDSAQLLQVSAMITDSELHRITPPEEDLNLFVQLDPAVPLSDWVEKNLADLLKHCRGAAAVPVQALDGRLTAWLDHWAGTPLKTIQKRPLLCGNSIHNDWMLARRFLPEFIARLHYRLLDVSVLKMEWLARGGEEFDKESAKTVTAFFPAAEIGRLKQHDAYYDIIASAAELAFYRKNLYR